VLAGIYDDLLFGQSKASAILPTAENHRELALIPSKEWF
jgi:hypothetical protein